MSLVLFTAILLGVNGTYLTGAYNQLTGSLTNYTATQTAESVSNQAVSAPKMEIIISGTGGTVTENYYIKKSIPRSQLTDKIVDLSKKGTPMITLGNGSGPRVMIVAGVHGNELPSQIAAMKLSNYLSGKPINGTVYIVPFVVPSNTAKSARFWEGENLNSVSSC